MSNTNGMVKVTVVCKKRANYECSDYAQTGEGFNLMLTDLGGTLSPEQVAAANTLASHDGLKKLIREVNKYRHYHVTNKLSESKDAKDLSVRFVPGKKGKGEAGYPQAVEKKAKAWAAGVVPTQAVEAFGKFGITVQDAKNWKSIADAILAYNKATSL